MSRKWPSPPNMTLCSSGQNATLRAFSSRGRLSINSLLPILAVNSHSGAGQYDPFDHSPRYLYLPFISIARKGPGAGNSGGAGSIRIVFVDGSSPDQFFRRKYAIGLIVNRIEAYPRVSSPNHRGAVHNGKIYRFTNGEFDE